MKRTVAAVAALLTLTACSGSGDKSAAKAHPTPTPVTSPAPAIHVVVPDGRHTSNDLFIADLARHGYVDHKHVRVIGYANEVCDDLDAGWDRKQINEGLVIDPRIIDSAIRVKCPQHVGE